MTKTIHTSESHPLRVDWIDDPRAEWLGLTLAPGRGGPSQTYGGEWRRDLETDLLRLTEVHKTSVLVCLIEGHEFRYLGIPDLIERAQSHGLEVIYFPVVDGGTPSTSDEVVPLVEAILAHGVAGRRVVIHCRAGLGRTGTIAGCCLAALGFDSETILRRLRQDRSQNCPENDVQRNFIRQYCRAIANRAANQQGGLPESSHTGENQWHS